jgi:hypothetical protein
MICVTTLYFVYPDTHYALLAVNVYVMYPLEAKSLSSITIYLPSAVYDTCDEIFGKYNRKITFNTRHSRIKAVLDCFPRRS